MPRYLYAMPSSNTLSFKCRRWPMDSLDLTRKVAAMQASIKHWCWILRVVEVLMTVPILVYLVHFFSFCFLLRLLLVLCLLLVAFTRWLAVNSLQTVVSSRTSIDVFSSGRTKAFWLGTQEGKEEDRNLCPFWWKLAGGCQGHKWSALWSERIWETAGAKARPVGNMVKHDNVQLETCNRRSRLETGDAWSSGSTLCRLALSCSHNAFGIPLTA